MDGTIVALMLYKIMLRLKVVALLLAQINGSTTTTTTTATKRTMWLFSPLTLCSRTDCGKPILPTTDSIWDDHTNDIFAVLQKRDSNSWPGLSSRYSLRPAQANTMPTWNFLPALYDVALETDTSWTAAWITADSCHCKFWLVWSRYQLWASSLCQDVSWSAHVVRVTSGHARSTNTVPTILRGLDEMSRQKSETIWSWKYDHWCTVNLVLGQSACLIHRQPCLQSSSPRSFVWEILKKVGGGKPGKRRKTQDGSSKHYFVTSQRTYTNFRFWKSSWIVLPQTLCFTILLLKSSKNYPTFDMSF